MTQQRTVIFVVAPTASGKTTAAMALGRVLGLPVVHADGVYDMLKAQHDIPVESSALTDFTLWDDPRNFGIESWGIHASMHDAKVECFRVMLHPHESSDLIIEGFTLSFARERLAILELTGATRSVTVRIDLPFERWASQYESKFGVSAASMGSAFEYLQSRFERIEGEAVLSCSSPEALSVPPITDLLQALVGRPGRGGSRRMRARGLTARGGVGMDVAAGAEAFVTKDELVARIAESREEGAADERLRRGGSAALEVQWHRYHRAIEILSDHGVSRPGPVLELGAPGGRVVRGSDLIGSTRSDAEPGVLHDARRIPWPIDDRTYDWFVAVDGFSSLWPVQREAFEEARRVARNVLLVATAPVPAGDGGGLAGTVEPDAFREWNEGAPPDICEPVDDAADAASLLYVWFRRR